MCAVMQVSSSGYYDWQNRDQDVSKITAREDFLKKIRASYESSDSTYGSPRITKGEGWLYLTAVMDLADRKIIGWVLNEGMSTEQTTLAALERALKARKAEKGLIFYSDRGVQYACNVFKDKLKAKDRRGSKYEQKG